MKSKNKKKLQGIIFARAFCCIGIVIYHYFCVSNEKFNPFYKTANSDFGFLYVTSFFCISGAVLYYNYPKILSIKSFYYKRWKSILVPYHICFTYFFLTTAFRAHKIFYKGDWSRIFITIIGLDGYFKYKIKTYYLVGEWFLGAIIIIYILYPIILFLVNKCNIIVNNIIICSLYLLMYKTKFFIIGKRRNIITCIASFYFGMEIIRFEKFYLMKKMPLFICIFVLVFLTFIKIETNIFILIYQIQGFSLFIVLYQVGQYIMKTRLNAIFIEISNLSYGIYLYHHRIIYDILSMNNPKANERYLLFLLLAFSTSLTIICAKIHTIVVNLIYRSYIFKKLDSIFI